MKPIPPSDDAPAPASREKPSTPAWLQWLEPRLEALRFGSVHLTVHDGRITQIELTERTRLT
jgi:hypothetical protein